LSARSPAGLTVQLAQMGSVDGWPLAITIIQALGGKPKPVAALGRDRRTASSSLGAHVAVRGGLAARSTLRRTAPWGTQWGQLDGPRGPPPYKSLGSGGGLSGPGAFRGRPFLANYSTPLVGVAGVPFALPSRGGRSGAPAQDSYLVDSASSHMLVSKIKPCMSKYKQSIR
jgi:hypothetical protein